MHDQRSRPASSEEQATRRFYDEPDLRPSAPQASRSNDRRRALAFVLIGIGVAMLLSNLGRLPFMQGPRQSYGVKAPLNGATTARVYLDWGSGDLRLEGGEGDDLITGSAHAARPLLVDVNKDGDVAEVSIRPRGSGWLFGGTSSTTADLTLNDHVHYDSLEFNLASGAANIDLSRLKVDALALDGGSGSIALQLPVQGATRGTIDLDSGSLSMVLPPATEARITIDSGSGHFDPGQRLRLVDGDADDGVYETPNYAGARQRIDLELDGGSGSILIR